MSELYEYVAAGLLHGCISMRGQTPQELADVFNDKFNINIDEEVIWSAALILSDCGIGITETDPYAGQFIKISEELCESFLEKVKLESAPSYEVPEDKSVAAVLANSFRSLTNSKQLGPHLSRYNKYKVLRRYHEFGGGFIENALASISVNGFVSGSIPASDRLVSASDNQEAYEQSLSLLDQLSEHMKSSNEVGEIFGDNREIAAQEISILRAFIAKTLVRAEPALVFAKKCLGWIAEKAGGAAVGEIAKRALKAIIEWLG